MHSAAAGPAAWGDLSLGADAERAYTDALLALLPPAPGWEPYTDGRWARRKGAKVLRRAELGY